jgi:hypothetical protein
MKEARVLGRHVYRVTPLAQNGWSVQKEGETTARGHWPTRDAAVRQACELAAADEPSRLVVEDPAGTIAEERLFGVDAALDLERAATGERGAAPKGEPRR